MEKVCLNFVPDSTFHKEKGYNTTMKMNSMIFTTYKLFTKYCRNMYFPQ